MSCTRKLFLLSILFVFTSWAVFAGDVTVELLYRTAVENNIELQTLGVESRQAELDRLDAEASRFPSIDFQTSLTYMTKPLLEPITLTAGELGAYDIAGTSVLMPLEDMTIFGGTENTHYDFKFILDQPLYTWGKITNAIGLYSRIEDTSALRIESKLKEIKTGIRIYYHSLFYIMKMEQSLNEQIEDAKRLITLAEQSYNNGFILYADLLQAKIQAKELEIASAKLNEQKEQALLSLSRLSGYSDLQISDFNFDKMQKVENIKILKKQDYFDSALLNSPEIRMMNQLKDINSLRVDISKGSAGLKPDIGLHLELGYSGPRFPFIEIDWFRQDSLNLTSTIAIQSNIYDGGKPRYKIERDIEELEKSYYQYELGIESLNHLITESILKLDLNRRNIEYYRLLQENDRQQIDLKKTQLEAGSGSENEMLAEKINLNTHKIDEYTETIDFFKNYFTLIGASSNMQ